MVKQGVRARLHRLADRDVARHHDARDRGAQDRVAGVAAGDVGVGLVILQRRLGGGHVELGLLQLLERDGLVRVEILVARQDHLLGGERRLVAREVGLHVGGVGAGDRQERLTRLDLVALVHQHLGHAAADQRHDVAGLELVEVHARGHEHRQRHRRLRHGDELEVLALRGRHLEQLGVVVVGGVGGAVRPAAARGHEQRRQGRYDEGARDRLTGLTGAPLQVHHEQTIDPRALRASLTFARWRSLMAAPLPETNFRLAAASTASAWADR